MGLIDKKLDDLGFKRWNVHVGKSACYVRMFHSVDGKETGHSQFVEIVRIGDELYLGSYIKGIGCERGRNCSHPLRFNELKLFLWKMRWLKISWKIGRWFKRGKK